jgi:hypothetical protein
MIKKQLKSIVFGLVFILLNFNIRFDSGGFLNLLPNFVGYFMLFRAMTVLLMENDSMHFIRTRKYSFILVLLHVVFFFMDLLGITAALSIDLILVSLTTSVVGLILQLFFLYNLTLGIMSINLDSALNKKLQTTFRVVAIGNVLVYIVLGFESLALIFLLITLVANVIYIVTIHNIAKLLPETY